MTTTDALNYLLLRVAHAGPDDPLLSDALTRLAVASANQPDSQERLDHFEREFRLERGRLRLLKAIRQARRIEG